MTYEQINAKVEELKELKTMAKELSETIGGLEDELKLELHDRGLEELSTGIHMVKFKEVLSNRLDSTALKAEHPDLYKAYTKQTLSYRFTAK